MAETCRMVQGYYDLQFCCICWHMWMIRSTIHGMKRIKSVNKGYWRSFWTVISALQRLSTSDVSQTRFEYTFAFGMTSSFITEFWKFLNNVAVTFSLNWFQILKTHTRIPLRYWVVILRMEREKIPWNSSSFKHRNNPLDANKITELCTVAELHSDTGVVLWRKEREFHSRQERDFLFVATSKTALGLPRLLSVWLQTI